MERQFVILHYYSDGTESLGDRLCKGTAEAILNLKDGRKREVFELVPVKVREARKEIV